MKFNDAVIIAGGMGSRMMPLTDYVPKPLVKVNNVPLIRYVINFLKNNSIDNVLVTYGYKGDLLLKEIHKDVSGFINTEGKDNAYFLFNTAVKHIDRPIIVCPCDMIVQIDLEEVKRDYEKLGSPAACIVPVKTKLDADAILLDGDRVLAISREVTSDLYASGIQILNPKKINENISGFTNFYDVWKALIDKKMLYCTKSTPTEWKIFDRLTDLS